MNVQVFVDRATQDEATVLTVVGGQVSPASPQRDPQRRSSENHVSLSKLNSSMETPTRSLVTGPKRFEDSRPRPFYLLEGLASQTRTADRRSITAAPLPDASYA